MEKKALGRGLGALIPPKEEIASKKEIINVQTGHIMPNQFQPREIFQEDAIQGLAQSIKEKGVIQPLLVRRHGDQYELIAGERRLRAAKLLNLPEVPVIVKEVDDKDSLEIALIENMQRQDLNAIEEARAFQYLIEKFSLTQEALSEVLGKSRVTVTNTLRLLKLPLEVQDEIKNGRISFAHGRALLEIEDVNHQRKLCQEIIAKGLSVKELESLLKSRRPQNIKRISRPSAMDPVLAALEEAVQHALSTKVRVIKNKKRGHIVIEFYSQEDLARIINIIRGGLKT